WQRAILLGGGEVCFRAPTAFVMDCEAGTPIGLYPLTPARGRSVGLEWAIDGLDLSADGRLGTSNRVIGGRVELTVQSGDILVSLPLACLESVVGGLVVKG
ncbi:MAG: thiamine pyrophosphokinase, partial [Proteobacteria bacterium]|nr:thiamine pyrophosphokinase [Pseudomonadota bacterium]